MRQRCGLKVMKWLVDCIEFLIHFLNRFREFLAAEAVIKILVIHSFYIVMCFQKIPYNFSNFIFLGFIKQIKTYNRYLDTLRRTANNYLKHYFRVVTRPSSSEKYVFSELSMNDCFKVASDLDYNIYFLLICE